MSNDSPDYQEIMLDGTHFLARSITPSAIDRFAPKMTIGDYQVDSNDLLSTWILKDLTGGNGVSKQKPGMTDNRYRMATLYTRYPGQITKPFAITYDDIGSGSVFPLGEMYDYANSEYDYYAASGTDLFRDNVDTTSNLTGAPASKGVAYRGGGSDTFFYIPMGGNGYAVYEPDGPTFANINGGTSDDNFQAFCVWYDKLLGIANNGQISYATSAANPTTFTSYGTGGRLDRSIEPKSLQVFRNAQGEYTPFVVTDSGVYAFDAATPQLYEIADFYSNHPYFGIASCVWRGLLYVAAGMDILEYNGGVVRNVGLSKNDGLPWYYSNYVRDLVPAQNALYALVRGQTLSGTTYYSVHEYSEFGWHCVYTGTGIPVRAAVTRAGTPGTYRLYWGESASGVQIRQKLPVSFTNPEEELAGGLSTMTFGDFTQFTVSGGDTTYDGLYYLETGEFDAGMPGYRKIANAVEIKIPHLAENKEIVRVKYRIDGATAWTQLGADITDAGEYTLPFGTLTDGVYPGISWKTIEFRWEVQDNILAPYIQSEFAIIEHMVFSFLKLQNPSWSWQTQIDLREPHNDLSPEQMLSRLITLKNSDTFFPMIHRDTTYRVRIAGFGDVEELGNDYRGMVTLNLLEVPLELGVPTAS